MSEFDAVEHSEWITGQFSNPSSPYVHVHGLACCHRNSFVHHAIRQSSMPAGFRVAILLTFSVCPHHHCINSSTTQHEGRQWMEATHVAPHHFLSLSLSSLLKNLRNSRSEMSMANFVQPPSTKACLEDIWGQAS
jgi:hypothetical protein